jgi:outer membrane immunogenic protein
MADGGWRMIMRCFHYAAVAAVAVVGFTSVASAADMPTKAPMYTKAPVMAPMYNWTGFYIGLNAGYSWGSQTNSLVAITGGGVTSQSNTDHLDGFIGGGQIGYNWQVNQWVLGLEADFQGSGQKADGSYSFPGFGPPTCTAFGCVAATTITYSDKLDWFGTVRGRIGYAMGATGNWLPYLTGGWAYGHGTISGTTSATGTSFSGSQDYSGWTVGGGVEWAFADHWSAKVEYLYIDFGNGPTVPVSTGLTIVSGTMTDNIVRAGINYKF